MSIPSTGLSDNERLAVSPRRAWHMLGCGNTHGYALLAAGKLESYLDGRSRRITMRSIHRYIADRLADTSSTPISAPTATPPRRRARPRKEGASGGVP
jgi:hypothetical protein